MTKSSKYRVSKDSRWAANAPKVASRKTSKVASAKTSKVVSRKTSKVASHKSSKVLGTTSDGGASLSQRAGLRTSPCHSLKLRSPESAPSARQDERTGRFHKLSLYRRLSSSFRKPSCLPSCALGSRRVAHENPMTEEKSVSTRFAELFASALTACTTYPRPNSTQTRDCRVSICRSS